jgi:hypothetical protein
MNTEEAYFEGFVKRASEYGYSEEEAVEIYKTAKIGPWSADQAGNMMADEQKLKAMAYNKKNHKNHYYFNPFVAGPITEALTRLNRRTNAGAADDGLAYNFLSGGSLANAIRGGEDRRATVRNMFNKDINGEQP